MPRCQHERTAEPGTGIDVRRNEIDHRPDGLGIGIHLYDCVGCKVRENTLTDGSKLVVDPGSTGNLITDNLLSAAKVGIAFFVRDRPAVHTLHMPDVAFSFQGQLKPFQQEAVESLSSRDFGVLSAPTGAGKTVVALYLIAQRKANCVIDRRI